MDDARSNGDAPAYTLIRDLPAADRPRERLRDYGAGALSNAELLAILLRTGSSRESALSQASRIIAHFDGLRGLARASFAELCAEKGLGEAKAAQLKAALELGVRAASATQDRVVVRSPEDVANLLIAEMSLFDQEHVRVVLLDARNQVLGTPEVYRGNVHATHVRLAEVFREPIRTNASGFVLVHNHPSGDPTPSNADVQLTQALQVTAKALDIDFLDHIIIAGGRYVSMQHLHLGFPKQEGAAT